MLYITALRQVEQLVREAFSLFNVNDIKDISYEEVWTIDDNLQCVSKKLLEYDENNNLKAARDLTLSKGITDQVWVQSTIHRMNVATFTMALWSNTDYNDAVSNFFSMLIPKELHDQYDVIDVYLETIGRWAVVDMLATIHERTVRDLIDKVKARIDGDLKGQYPLLYRRILEAFVKRFKYRDSTPLYSLSDMFEVERVQEAWLRVLPIVLEAIDSKVDLQQHATTSRNDHTNQDPYNCKTMEEALDALKNDNQTTMEKDNHGSSEEPHIGMTHSNDQQRDEDQEQDDGDQAQDDGDQEQDDEDQVEKSYRHEPVVVSEIPEDEASLGSPRDGTYEDEYDDVPPAWDDDNWDYYPRIPTNGRPRIGPILTLPNFGIEESSTYTDPENCPLNTPDEPHTGTMHSHNQEENDIDSVDEHHRPEPMVVSASTNTRMEHSHDQEEDDIDPLDEHRRPEPTDITDSSESEEDQGSPRDGNNQEDNNDTSNAWGEDNGSDAEYYNWDGSHLFSNRNYHPPPPTYLNRRSASYSDSVCMFPFSQQASSTCIDPEHYHVYDDGNIYKAPGNECTSFGPMNDTSSISSQYTVHIEDGGSTSEQDVALYDLPDGLTNTINLGPVSPILLHEDPFISISVAEHARQMRVRDDVVRGGATRAHNLQQRQQDDQGNNLLNDNVTDDLVTQHNRPRRDLPADYESDITPPIPPIHPEQPNLRKLNEYWTDEEIAALDEGLRLYNKRWAVIKARYPNALANRTNVQLKDKARNIARQRQRDRVPLEHYEGCG